MNAIELEEKHGSGLFNMRGINIVRGKGAKLWDDSGKEYIDCLGSHGAMNVGHCNPYVVEAIEKQARELIMSSPLLNNELRAMLYEKLATITPKGLERTFLCNSGTEAVEAAIKFARGSTGKKEIIAFKNGFSGRTMGALSATWNLKYRKPFEPLVPGFRHVAYGKIDELRKEIGSDTAAVLIEPIQGEGGVRIPPDGYLKEVEELCRKKDVLLIMDEIQTGFARTGKMFACMYDRVEPDIMCLAKSIAGGVPMGAAVFSDAVASRLKKGWHGGTFGGNPLACAASLAAIRYIEDHKLEKAAAKKGEYMLKGLKDIDAGNIREARGRGLMLALEFKEKAGRYITALMEEGVFTLPTGSAAIRFLPPLVISDSEMDFVLEKVRKVLT